VVGNCHKWLCAPKGAGFLFVREELRDRMRPVTISHGWNQGLSSSASRFQAMFDWTGTDDPTARLSVPAAIEAIGGTHPSGWPGVMEANHSLAMEGRSLLMEALGVGAPAPEDMIGAMVSLPLPNTGTASQGIFDPLTERLRHHHRIEVPVFAWPASHPQGWIRISAQRYNSISQYRRLADVLAFELGLRSAGQCG
jgi:isopenicillin-N epimerase